MTVRVRKNKHCRAKNTWLESLFGKRKKLPQHLNTFLHLFGNYSPTFLKCTKKSSPSFLSFDWQSNRKEKKSRGSRVMQFCINLLLLHRVSLLFCKLHFLPSFSSSLLCCLLCLLVIWVGVAATSRNGYPGHFRVNIFCRGWRHKPPCSNQFLGARNI